ncbi:hypothetical protein SMC26_11815 [Actinomadura fulvescens]|uniref:hypothetical protein n=1 Tax=Actinomadura fulvescens TaxID=46160 RepID=UPI0031D5F1B8
MVTAVLVAVAMGGFGKLSKKVAEPSMPLKVTATTDRISLSVVFPGLHTISEQMQIDTGGSKVEGLRRQWLAAGASHFDEAGLSIGVRLLNRGERRVRVIGLEVVDLGRKPPLDGTLLHLPGQGGADVFRIAFNLDEARPVPREVDKQGKVQGPFFRQQELELSKGDRDTIWVPVAVSRYSVKFRLKLSYLVGDAVRPQHVTLDDGGLPFALTAVNCPRGLRTYRRIYTSLTPRWDNLQSRLKEVPNPAKYWAPVQASLGPCPQDFASKIKQIAQVTG